MEEKPILGVIGGSGLYAMEGLEVEEQREVATPFGKPSSPLMIGKLAGKRVVFLVRHGIGHHLSPSEVNYRANIYALKQSGVDRVLSVSACGSLREDYVPGQIVLPDQIFDHTKGRASSFFEGGLVAHVGVAEPFCAGFSSQVAGSVKAVGGTVHQGGTFITIEGPRFSTRAESNTFRAWGMSIIGMTTSPEAFLAREAELCYAVMAHVTDYDVWHVSEETVSVELVIRTLQKNTDVAQAAIASLVGMLAPDEPCDCQSALASARITDPQVIPAETSQRLGLFLERYRS